MTTNRNGGATRRGWSLRGRARRWAVAGVCMFGLLSLGGCPEPSEPVPDDARTMTLTRLASGFTAPVGLVAPNDNTGRLFVVDQVGVIHVMSTAGTVSLTPLLDLRDRLDTLNSAYDERGLLSMALHPSFTGNGRFYVFYNTPPSEDAPGGAATEVRVSEFTVSALNPNQANVSTERVLLRVAKPATNHNGGQLAFGPDGFLYIGLGDGGGAGDTGTGHTLLIGNAQDTTNLFGAILRIDVNSGNPYGIPTTNPFAASLTSRPEIYAYGLRNPWRFSFDTTLGGTTRLIAGDVGQALVEEIDIIERGGNYGWNIREGSLCFNPLSFSTPLSTCSSLGPDGSTLQAPILEYRHTDDAGKAFGTAVVGGYVYRGSTLAALRGLYVFGDYSAGGGTRGKIFTATEGTTAWTMAEVKIAGTTDGRIGRYVLGFGRDAANELYVLTSAVSGPIGATGAVDKITGFE